jgi:hypothetical protein
MKFCWESIVWGTKIYWGRVVRGTNFQKAQFHNHQDVHHANGSISRLTDWRTVMHCRHACPRAALHNFAPLHYTPLPPCGRLGDYDDSDAEDAANGTAMPEPTIVDGTPHVELKLDVSEYNRCVRLNPTISRSSSLHNISSYVYENVDAEEGSIPVALPDTLLPIEPPLLNLRRGQRRLYIDESAPMHHRDW